MNNRRMPRYLRTIIGLVMLICPRRWVKADSQVVWRIGKFDQSSNEFTQGPLFSFQPPKGVWPWLVQMGSGRGGWYAYDFIDNGGHRSADSLLPEYQNIAVGNVLPALPGATDVFVVAQCEPEHNLVLAWRLPSGEYQTTWAFVLESNQPGETRLIVRGRVAPGYRPFGLPQWFAIRSGALADS
jgi:hypothetical protein